MTKNIRFEIWNEIQYLACDLIDQNVTSKLKHISHKLSVQVYQELPMSDITAIPNNVRAQLARDIGSTFI